MNSHWRIDSKVSVAAALCLLASAGCGGGSSGDLSASGTVEATVAQLGFQAVGRLDAVRVQEGDSAAAGDTLAVLDLTEARARLAQAAAQAQAARALLSELQSGFRPEEIAQAEAAYTAAQQQLLDADRDLARARTLLEGGAISQEVLDKASVAYEVAQSRNRQAEENFKLMREGPRRERVEAQRAQCLQADAAVNTMEAVMANMVIRAPFDGVVSVRHREPGETVPLGSPVLSLLNRQDRWIRIYIPEPAIGAVRLGQAATISCDTYPDQSFGGEVVFVASQAEFTPKTVQTTEERVKLVYAVKVRVTLDPEYVLKPGLPADVRLVQADE
jgi:HlyD family secretion protein